MGIRGQRATGAAAGNGALDDVGTERKSYGGYLQGTYDFGQGTSAGYTHMVVTVLKELVMTF